MNLHVKATLHIPLRNLTEMVWIDVLQCVLFPSIKEITSEGRGDVVNIADPFKPDASVWLGLNPVAV